MKLRNKKTGEITDNIWFSQIADGIVINGNSYKNLDEINKDWEDYTPAEPLIKDEKIRKAVRTWADLFGYKFVTHRFYTTTTGHRWSLLERESQEICLPDLDGLYNSKDYTIAELCGEEEE